MEIPESLQQLLLSQNHQDIRLGFHAAWELNIDIHALEQFIIRNCCDVLDGNLMSSNIEFYDLVAEDFCILFRDDDYSPSRRLFPDSDNTQMNRLYRRWKTKDETFDYIKN